jgi:hypothetical protein
VTRAWEPSNVWTNLGNDDFCGATTHARDRVQPVQHGLKRALTLPDLRGQSLDGLLEEDGGDPNPGRRGFAELWARCSADAPARRAEELTKQWAEELT